MRLATVRGRGNPRGQARRRSTGGPGLRLPEGGHDAGRPYLVTPDELPGGVRPELATRLSVDGVETQRANTADLLFDPVDLVRYISTIMRLRPGDLILTGTNGGVGHARSPQELLWGGERVETTVEKIGTLTHTIMKG